MSPRLDLWLFHARFFKSRVFATAMITAGHLRLNRQHCLKPGHGVSPGDVLTFPQGNRIRVIRVLALGERRGPAGEAERLYDDLDANAAGPGAAAGLE